MQNSKQHTNPYAHQSDNQYQKNTMVLKLVFFGVLLKPEIQRRITMKLQEHHKQLYNAENTDHHQPKTRNETRDVMIENGLQDRLRNFCRQPAQIRNKTVQEMNNNQKITSFTCFLIQIKNYNRYKPISLQL